MYRLQSSEHLRSRFTDPGSTQCFLSQSGHSCPCCTHSLVTAQSASRWCDDITAICFSRYYLEATDTTWAYLFPSDASTDEFIGMFIAPSSVGWIGSSLGASMLQNPLVIAWTNGNSPLVSTRWANNIGSPPVLSGPQVTLLGSSGVNATHQRIVFRCQNCTSWTGGANGINLNGVTDFGYSLHQSIKPLTPSDPASTVYQHTAAGRYSIDIAAAKTPLYRQYLQQLVNAPPVTGGATATTTTSPSPTSSVLCPGAPQPSYALTTASGWAVTPVLGGLGAPRGITLDSRGNLLVVERGKGITIHTLDSTGCVTSSKILIADTTLNHGIDLNPAGDKLFATSADIAWSWDYDPATQSVSNKQTLITEMYNAGHTTRTIRVSRKNPNKFYVSVGSDGNVDLPSFSVSSGRAQIRVFDLRSLTNSGGVPYAGMGQVMGYGLRNDVGMDEDPSGVLFSVENSLDNAYRTIDGQQRDVHNNNPAEKAYKLGTADSPGNLFGGYPYCFSVSEPSDFNDTSFQPGDWFVQASDDIITDEWCDVHSGDPIALLPPHTAPLDLKFGPGVDSNMYISLHGSWDRSPPLGYKVITVPGTYSSSGAWSPTGTLQQTMTSYVDILRNTDENQCASGCFRPVGLVFDSSGANLYVSSDTSGEIFLLKRTSGPVSTTTFIPVPTPTTTTTTRTTTSPTTTETGPQPTQTLWGQCGGYSYTGPKICPPGAYCNDISPYYYQCQPN